MRLASTLLRPASRCLPLRVSFALLASAASHFACGADDASAPSAASAGRAGAAGSPSKGGSAGVGASAGHAHGGASAAGAAGTGAFAGATGGAAGGGGAGHDHGGGGSGVSGQAGSSSGGTAGTTSSAGNGGTGAGSGGQNQGGSGASGQAGNASGGSGASGQAGNASGGASGQAGNASGGASGAGGTSCVDAPPGKPTGSTGETVDGCVQGLDVGGGKIRQCIRFPSGVRVKDLRPVVDSFGTADPPCDTAFADVYAARPDECSVRTHDRYWVRANDGHVYRTWHPPTGLDAETGQACEFGHEHGDDPRASPLYQWAGGVPFGITNRASDVGGNHHRHEDHYGHKVVVQNDWDAVLGNPPDDAPIKLAGFRCYWLSKVHQGTHSGDSLFMNEHEYENNLMCDDGATRNPDPGREAFAGKAFHTESSVKTLTTWGRPNELHPCGSQVGLPYPGGTSDGREPPPMSDTKREIQCAKGSPGWLYKPLPTPVASETGDVDYARAADGSSGGVGEIWKPWMTIVTREGKTVFTSSAYYGVHNPARLYNPDGSVVPQRDVNGDGKIDDWIPTLEMCLAAANAGNALCKGIDFSAFPAAVAKTEWWKLPQSPFNGTIRWIHPKGTDMSNGNGRAELCTDYTGKETTASPTAEGTAGPRCPDGQVFQRVAATDNLWGYASTWTPAKLKDDTGHGVGGSAVNARNGTTKTSGFQHEWVRFFGAPGIRAPN